MDFLCTIKIKIEIHNSEHGYSWILQNYFRQPKFGIWVYQRPVTIQKLRSKCQTPVRNLKHPPKPQSGPHEHRCSLHHEKLKYRAKIWKLEVSKTSNHIHIRIKMPNHSRNHPCPPCLSRLL